MLSRSSSFLRALLEGLLFSGISGYLRFKGRLAYLNAETQEKFQNMAAKRFMAENGNTLSIMEMMQKAHFTNVFHYHDRHNIRLREIGKYVSNRDFVVLVALCHLASSVFTLGTVSHNVTCKKVTSFDTPLDE